MLYIDLNYVNMDNKLGYYGTMDTMDNKLALYIRYEFKNLIISLIDGAKFIEFNTLVVWGHLEETVSQIFI